MSSDLAITAEKQTNIIATRDQIDLIKRSICNGATDDELRLFIDTCNRYRLDPFARQIYCIKRWDSGKNGFVMTPQVSIDGFRIIAERSDKYAGQLGPWWCGEDRVWSDAWLSFTPPLASKVGVLRKDFKEPIFAVAKWDSYVVLGGKEKRVGPMWQKMPEVMLAKCAESLALRKAFPNDLSGLYTEDEMGQANNNGVTNTVELKHAEPEQERKMIKHARSIVVSKGITKAQVDFIVSQNFKKKEVKDLTDSELTKFVDILEIM